jgi:hypothetical protein
LLATCSVATAASGATYDVTVCGDAPGKAVRSWSSANSQTDTLETDSACGAGGDFGGLAALDRLQTPSNTPPAAHAEWSFVAPGGTTITRAAVERYVGKELTNSWTVFGRLDDQPAFDTCDFDPSTASGCFVGFPGGGGGSRVVLESVNGTRLTYGIACTPSTPSCANGGTTHRAWAVVYAATITLTDTSQPSIRFNSLGSTSSWNRGAVAAGLTATDNSGIQSSAIGEGSRILSNQTRACDYSRAVPCTNEPGAEHTIDLTKLTDGPHTLVATATDAAANVARSDPRTILVDNHAPTAPQGMQVVGGDGWRLKDAFDVTWVTPDQAPGAPVGKVHWRLCAADGACEPEHVVDGGVAELRGLVVPRQGDWTLGVWLEDVAGNVAEANAGQVHLRFGRNPRAGAGLRFGSVVRRGRRLVVRGRLAKGASGNVVVRVRRTGRRQLKPRVARRASVRTARFVATLKLPSALRRANRLRISLSYSGDAAHRRASVVRIVRPVRR